MVFDRYEIIHHQKLPTHYVFIELHKVFVTLQIGREFKGLSLEIDSSFGEILLFLFLCYAKPGHNKNGAQR